MIMTPRRTKALNGKTIGQIFLEDPEEVRENYCFLLLIQGLGRLSHSLGGELRMESSDRRASKSFVTGFVIELFRLVDEIGTGYKRLSVVLELGRKRDAGWLLAIVDDRQPNSREEHLLLIMNFEVVLEWTASPPRSLLPRRDIVNISLYPREGF
jgi:hypothetical protein